MRSIVIHGHFYQPPRDDPWTGIVPAEPSAAPFHDWNERIDHECYQPLLAARVLRPDGRIDLLVNTLARISFNFGPTLLSWMERHAPRTYRAILDADATSRALFGGHGNALAQPYHHSILPLLSRRDKTTEVRWGIADFRRRFNRDPEGMWLPEAAVDHETLDVLASEGIAFTVVAPNQIDPVPPRGRPGFYRTTGGQSIALFAYNGPISHDVAFGGLLRDADAWLERLSGDTPESRRGVQLISIATDGETYGHHHRFGDLALAALVTQIDNRKSLQLTNFGEFLTNHRPRRRVDVVSPSSWSCAHGVERWRSNCGCKAHPTSSTSQAWRAPLRAACDWLMAELHDLFEQEAGALLGSDPWDTRDRYGAVLDVGPDERSEFVRNHMTRLLAADEQVRARELLELERFGLRMFTSCGWFFDDLAGHETDLILRSAARAIELAGADAARLEQGFAERLTQAVSNPPNAVTGNLHYHEHIKPQVDPALRAAAGLALRHAVRSNETAAELSSGCFRAVHAADRLELTHERTGRTWTFDIDLQQDRLAHPRVAVSADGRAPVTVELADLFEHDHDAVVSTLRGMVASRWFGHDDLAALRTGAADFPRTAERAVERAITALETDHTAEAIDRAVDLIGLLDLVGCDVPLSAQATFYRLWRTTTPDRVRAFEPVADALGFHVPDSDST